MIMKYKVCIDVTVEEVDGCLAMVTSNGDVAVLNDVASFILAQVMNNEDDKTVAEVLLQNYDVDSETATTDVKKIIEDLCEKKLIQLVDEV